MWCFILAFLWVIYPPTGERIANHLLAGVSALDSLFVLSLWVVSDNSASINSTMAESMDIFLPEAFTKAWTSFLSEAYNAASAILLGSLDEPLPLPCLAYTL